MKKVIYPLMGGIMLMSMFLSACGPSAPLDPVPPDPPIVDPPTPPVASDPFEIYDLMTEDLVEPLGIDEPTPSFSWRLRSDVIGQKQTAYRILVKDGEETVWDSGKVQKSENANILYDGIALTPSTKYDWTVTVWDKDDKPQSAESSFETGLMTAPLADADFISYAGTSVSKLTQYSIEFDARIDNADMGFILGADGPFNCVMISLNTHDRPGKIMFWPHTRSGGWNMLKPDNDVTAKVCEVLGISSASDVIGKYIHWRFEVDGKIIKSYFGNRGEESVLLDETEYPVDVALKKIGFRIDFNYNEQVTYDNFVIKDANGDVLYENGFEASVDFVKQYGDTPEGIVRIEDGELRGSAAGFNINGEGVWLYDTDSSQRYPAYRKSFSTAEGKEVASARLYATALGAYNAYLNGERVGKRLSDGTMEYYELEPGNTKQEKRKFYSTYDVTDMLTEGNNALSAVVGTGWWVGPLAYNVGQETAFCAKLLICYTDGTSETLVTDESWKCERKSSIRYGDIYNGESYDARVPTDWMDSDFSDDTWQTAKVNTEFEGEISAFKGTHITEKPSLKQTVQSVVIYEGAVGASAGKYGHINIKRAEKDGSFTLHAGETAVVDLGRNFTGWEEFTVTGARGAVITIDHGEVLNAAEGESALGYDGPAGSVYDANYRTAQSITEYTLCGDEEGETYHPTFTYYGFRYLSITASDTVEFKNITGHVLSSVDPNATFVTSDEDVNSLFSMLQWTYLSNYFSVVTDCAERDERLAWTDGYVMSSDPSFYFVGSRTLLEKALQDFADCQNADGSFPAASPYGEAGGVTTGGAAGWSDAAVIVLHHLYKTYGDTDIVEKYWPMVTKYVDEYLASHAYDGIRTAFGDWLTLETENAEEVRKVVAQGYYILDLQYMKEMAEAIGLEGAALTYETKLHYEKDYFRTEFMNENGMKNPYQATAAWALHVADLDGAEREKVIDQLTAALQAHGGAVVAGLHGSRYLLEAAVESGRADLAFGALLGDADFSYLAMVRSGATTMWERQNGILGKGNGGFGDVNSYCNPGMNSFNHVGFLGGISDFLFKTVAGIEVDFTASHPLQVSPKLCAQLPKVEASFESVFGLISILSDLTDEGWKVTLTVPMNASAQVQLPMVSAEGVTVNGKALNLLTLEKDGILFTGIKNGLGCFETVSGSFTFSIPSAAVSMI